jgi:hypothetical protein
MSDERKRSWAEIDRLRDGARRDDRDRPRNAASQARTEAATQTYLKEIDKLFSSTGRSAEANALVKRLRDAHGTPELANVCREFRDEVGLPRETALLSIFLDCNEPELVVDALSTLFALLEQEEIELGKGVQSQLRVLSQDFNNDIAEVAEDILAKLA